MSILNEGDTNAFAGIYGEIAGEFGVDVAERIHEMFHGQTVTFSQKLYKPEYVRTYIRNHRGEHSLRELSKCFGYSERRLRQFQMEECGEQD